MLRQRPIDHWNGQHGVQSALTPSHHRRLESWEAQHERENYNHGARGRQVAMASTIGRNHDAAQGLEPRRRDRARAPHVSYV